MKHFIVYQNFGDVSQEPFSFPPFRKMPAQYCYLFDNNIHRLDVGILSSWAQNPGKICGVWKVPRHHLSYIMLVIGRRLNNPANQPNRTSWKTN